jgi:pyrimidine deaminase RibD-like protein
VDIVESDRELMERAVRVARLSISEPDKVSPKVGAVIARGNSLMAEAHRGEYRSGEHAEYTLLERKLGDETLAGTTLFTTLEPCTERNDPKIPCADRIVERRISRVVIGVLDPNAAICGRGELRLRAAGIEVARFDSDLMAQIEEINRDFARLHAGTVRRTTEQTSDPAVNEVGPNGHRVAYNDEGDKVEMIPADGEPGEFWPMVLRRNDQQILDAYNEFWDKVWWNRHMARMHRIESGELDPPEGRDAALRIGAEAAARIEERYPIEELELDDFDFGLLSGRMSALSWVLGSEWNESLDT